MSHNPSTADLVTRAATGDKGAWDALVDWYAPLVWSICRSHRLGAADTARVGQAVWLQLLSQLGTVRDPAALTDWLAATTTRECGRARDAGSIADEDAGPARQDLRAAERDAVLREALSRLPPCCQRLITMLTEDPPVPYAQISATLGLAVDRIEPTRGRCLDQLRRDPAVAALTLLPRQTTSRDRHPHDKEDRSMTTY